VVPKFEGTIVLSIQRKNMSEQDVSLSQKLDETRYTWLITGVAGFIGSHLLEALLKRNQNVIGLDNFFSGHAHNITQALSHVSTKQRANFTFHTGDIRSSNDCNLAVSGVDYVLHQAALCSVPLSIKQPNLTHDINVSGFLNLLTAAANANVKRFVYASSCAVYGDAHHLPLHETEPTNLLAPYSASKYIDEVYAALASTCYGIETIGLRYFNVYGPRQDPKGPYSAVIARWVDALVHDKQTYRVQEDHHRSRDFCYVEDVAVANLLAATKQGAEVTDTIYNIASGQQVTLHTLYQTILKALNLENTRPPIFQPAKPGDIANSSADITKATQQLGYHPRYTIQEGIPRLIDSLKSIQRVATL
jgi:UDP-N-acetylglucosamine 4-epimerase